jgi:anti-sigma B factor antagonist
MPDSLSIAARNGAQPGRRILKFTGKLGVDTVPSFLKALRAETEKTLILEMSEMSYVDSSGVGAMVQQYSAMKKEARQMVLVRPHDRVVAVLQITKVLSLFQRFDSVEDAEAQLK